MNLPPLTPHAVDLESEFYDFSELLEEYTKGCPSMDGRQRNAIFASVIWAFWHPAEYNIQISKYLKNQEAIARLLYAALFANGFANSEEAYTYLDMIIPVLQSKIRGGPYELFIDMPQNAMNRPDPIQERAHIKEGVFFSQIIKLLK